jgi:hypothetical protein
MAQLGSVAGVSVSVRDFQTLQQGTVVSQYFHGMTCEKRIWNIHQHLEVWTDADYSLETCHGYTVLLVSSKVKHSHVLPDHPKVVCQSSCNDSMSKLDSLNGHTP